MALADHLALALVADLAVLAILPALRSAPPRIVAWVCLAGMLATTVPWLWIGSWLAADMVPDGYAFAFSQVLETSAPGMSMPAGGTPGDALAWILSAWGTGTVTWLVITFCRARQQRARLRAAAVPDDALRHHVLPRLRTAARQATFFLVQNSREALTSGLWRPQVWIGDRLSDDETLQVAVNHEVAHLQAGDHWFVHVLTVLERLFWWNPLTWILGAIARRHLEYACDLRCREYLGESCYRFALARIALQQHTAISAALHFGRTRGVMQRMERLTRPYSIAARHVVALAAVVLTVTAASAAVGGNRETPSRTLLDCDERLPEGVHYDLRIHYDPNTSENGRRSELALSLVDKAQPDSTAIPDGAAPYVNCVMDLVGVPLEDRPVREM